MNKKNSAEVMIAGKVYTLGGYEGEEYLQSIASYINRNFNELKKTEGFLRQSPDYQNMLLQLNIADDYMKAQRDAEALERKVQDKEKELYNLKHEMVKIQLQLEKLQGAAVKD